MLHSINITANHSDNNKSNIGQIAESLLFYREVNYLVKELNLVSLLLEIDVEDLLRLIDNHNLRIHFVESHLQLMTKKKGYYNQIGVGFIKPKNPIYQTIRDVLINKYGDSTITKSNIDKVFDRIEIFKHDAEITNKILGDYLDKDYLNNSIQTVNVEFIGDFKKPEFEAIRDSDTSYLIKDYIIEPNRKINTEIGILDSLNFLLEAREQIELGHKFNSEILTQESVSKVIQLNFNRLKRSINNVETYKTFQNVFVNKAANISQVINTNPEILSDYFQILEKSQKFRGWLDNIDDNTDLLSEYYSAISSKTWLEKAPVKNFKWIFDIGISTVLGLINPALGIGYSGLSGAVDKISENQWKPNMFIDKELKKIVK